MSSGALSLIVPLHSAVTFEPVGPVTNVFFDDRNCQVRLIIMYSIHVMSSYGTKYIIRA